ncbi:MAG: DUF6602 domain-containing protein [Parcubacteria group bacterium]
MKKEYRDLNNFLRSETEYVKSVSDRVRNLIGDKNWGEEGRYKEKILRRLLANHVGQGCSLKTGFVTTRRPQGDLESTHQIDILITHQRTPYVLEEDEFVITKPSNVLGVIEVKSNFFDGPKRIEEEISRIMQDRDILRLCSGNLFNAYFFFGFEEKANIFSKDSHVAKFLLGSDGEVTHCALGLHHIAIFYDRRASNPVKDTYRIYKAPDMVPSYFVGLLLRDLYPNEALPKINMLFSKEPEELEIVAELPLRKK